MSEDGYLLDNRQVEAGERFAALAELFDPWTQQHLINAGVRPGARCWEVGAGGPSLPQWLAEQVGAAGYVVATDIDTSWLTADAAYDVERHDVAGDPPPGGGPFDVIHARLVLVHVPQRDAALRTMISALAPGGVLLLEDADPALQPLLCPDERTPEEALANRLRNGFRELMAARGADLAFGRTLPRLLREAGLRDVRSDAYFPISGPACIALESATVRQIRDQLLSADLATSEEIERHLDAVESGRLDLTTAPLISAWGRATGI